MNCLAVETEGRLLLIDCGVMFAPNDSGIDVIHPNFERITDRRDDIEGIVLTHAHEDHVSGLPFLLRELDFPVYGGDYALELLKVKASEPGRTITPMIRPLPAGGEITLGPFQVRTFAIPHSIVQNTGLVITMPKGRILHTGDFKLGVNRPDKGNEALEVFKRAAGDGVDLMLSDSTGAEETDIVGEESEVRAVFDTLFAEATERLFVAIFSSNLRRLESVLALAQKYGRKVGLAGRSVQNHVRIAETTSELDLPSGLIRPLDELAEMPKDKVVTIVSGTQGEYRSALSRLARGHHHALKVEPGDTVLLSSRFIPGNELTISAMIDQLLQRGARVHHRYNTRNIHVSGHGGKDEIAAAIRAVKPTCFLPVHGTHRHLQAGAALAKAASVKHVAVATNGQTVHCSGEGLQVEDDAPGSHPGNSRVYIDQGGLLARSALRDRRILGTAGVLVVAFSVDSDGRRTSDVDVKQRGVVADEAEAWIADVVSKKVRATTDDENTVAPDNVEAYREKVRHAVRKLIQKQMNRDPLVVVSITHTPTR